MTIRLLRTVSRLAPFCCRLQISFQKDPH